MNVRTFSILFHYGRKLDYGVECTERETVKNLQLNDRLILRRKNGNMKSAIFLSFSQTPHLVSFNSETRLNTL